MQTKISRRWVTGFVSISMIGFLLFFGFFMYQAQHRELQPGEYLLANDEWPMPSLALADNGQFYFSSSVYSSYYGVGSYTRDGKWLTLATEDGLYHYVFTIGKHALKFDASKSNCQVPFGLEDGMVLERTKA